MRHDSEGFIPSTGIAERLTRTAIGHSAPQLFPQNNTMNLVPIASGWASVAGTPTNINWLNRWGETGNDYVQPSFADNVADCQVNHNPNLCTNIARVLTAELPGV